MRNIFTPVLGAFNLCFFFFVIGYKYPLKLFTSKTKYKLQLFSSNRFVLLLIGLASVLMLRIYEQIGENREITRHSRRSNRNIAVSRTQVFPF